MKYEPHLTERTFWEEKPEDKRKRYQEVERADIVL